MTNEAVFAMPLAKVYPLLEAKALRKGRTREEVLAVVHWLTGHTGADIDRLLADGVTYGDFFRGAPALNPRRTFIRGSICGVRIEQIDDPLMQDIRRLDKLIDDLARGKPLERLLPE